ncbi:ubiquitin carboxyl-terminal hydrolase 20-like isoform X2 [Lotus japonicus]|uniref:ubiquitin carboxyl-terminal hydrolase 20-like isoform X2 n=1 Tax=Lotus japonicus TaxID=34305 RepID=UPI0025827E51|nr:ubiquitin carboxyl-terminal hydrolase 20-like isoform X2 [Lotus japonicus]
MYLNWLWKRGGKNSPPQPQPPPPPPETHNFSVFIPSPNIEDYYTSRQLANFPFVVIPMSSPVKSVGAGVRNLGSTCFMSSILQCLTHTIKLFQGLRSYTHDCPGDAGEFCVFCALRSHMESCFTPARSVVWPIFLADNLKQFSAGFKRGNQEDAQDFMNRALNKLQGCFSEGHPNLVGEIFGGRYVSQLRCSNCGHCSETFEAIIDLSLGIENIYTIQDALESYTKVEKVGGKSTCNSCKQVVSMEKQLLLTQTPSVAALHLKRFRGGGISVKKIENHVFFTLELDLQPYTFGAENHNVELKYDLYAVVVHTGNSPNSGHYFCFVRSAPDKWHKLDDSESIWR